MTWEGRIGSVPEPDRDSQLGNPIAACLSNRSPPSSFPHRLDLAGVLRIVSGRGCDACNEAFRVCHGHPGGDDRSRGQQEAESHPIAPDLSHLLTNC
jgi:hypothetical protein